MFKCTFVAKVAVVVAVVALAVLAAVAVILYFFLFAPLLEAATITPTLQATTTTTMTTTPPPVSDLLDDFSNFPNGTITSPVYALRPGAPQLAPRIMNTTEVAAFFLQNVDPNFYIAEVGRQMSIYVVVPNSPSPSTLVNDSLSFSINTIGLQFGSSATVHLVPIIVGSQVIQHYNNANESMYELRVGIYLSESSSASVAGRKKRSSGSGCASLNSCTFVTITAYSVESKRLVSAKGNQAVTPLACGSQCSSGSSGCYSDSACYTCNGETISGTNAPFSRRYKTPTSCSGRFSFVFQTFTIPDRITVYSGLTSLADTGCIGSETEQQLTITYGAGSELRVDVEPNCMGTSSTAWYFSITCLQDQLGPIDVSQAGLDLIKSFEGFRNKSYQDIASVWTIGYGTIKYPNGTVVKDGDTCTETEAISWLLDEVNKIAIPAIQNKVTKKLNQNQIDALASFIYNVGASAFSGSTLLSRVNEDPCQANIKDAFLMWTKVTNAAGQKVDSKGLINRRTKESDYYFSSS